MYVLNDAVLETVIFVAVSEQDGLTETKSFHDAKSFQEAFSESQVWF